MQAEVLVGAIIGGVVLGGVYAILALGLTLVWGTMKVLNFAYGSFYIWGGYMWLFAYDLLGHNYIIATAVAMIFTLMLGFGLERGIVRVLRQRPGWELNVIVCTLALAFILDSLALGAWGPFYKRIPPSFKGNIPIFRGQVVTIHFLIILAAGLLILLVIYLFLKKTRLGMAMRAISDDIEGASLTGIDANKIYFYTLGIGSALAGLAATFLGYLITLSPGGGAVVILKAFIIIIIGGLGSISGAIFAAFIIGIVESMLGTYLGLGLAAPFLFLFMLLMLIVRPRGLRG